MKAASYSQLQKKQQQIMTPALTLIRFILFNLFALVASTSYAMAGSISGTVTDNAGVALRFVTVSAYLINGDNWSRSAEISTDEEGKYSLKGLPAGKYTLGYDKWGYAKEYLGNVKDRRQATIINLTENEIKQISDITLDRFGIIRGTIKDSSGQVIKGAGVTLYKTDNDGASWSKYGTHYTNNEGKYILQSGNSPLIDLIPGRKYRLKFFSSGHGFEFYKNVATLDEASDIVMAVDEERTINVVLGAPDEGEPEPPELEVTAIVTDGTASEKPGDTGVVSVSRSGSTDQPLTVHLLISGTAENGKDYKKIADSITIPAGQSSANIEIVPIADYDTTEQDETVIITLVDPVLQAASGAQAKTTVPKRAAARVAGTPAIITIINNPAPQGIPTLQEWALILLAMLLFMVAWRQAQIQKRRC